MEHARSSKTDNAPRVNLKLTNVKVLLLFEICILPISVKYQSLLIAHELKIKGKFTEEPLIKEKFISPIHS